MKYLVDSDWVADYLGAKQRAIQLLDTLAHDGLSISLIPLGEIYEGIYFGRGLKRSEGMSSECQSIQPPIFRAAEGYASLSRADRSGGVDRSVERMGARAIMQALHREVKQDGTRTHTHRHLE